MADNKKLPELDTGDDLAFDMEQAEKAAQLAQLKAQADLLSVPYAPNIGAETLAERIRAHKVANGFESDEEREIKEAIEQSPNGVAIPPDIKAQYEIFHAKQLIRVSVVCVNPAKSNLVSDLYTVYSSTLGRVSQVIPYQAPDGYHMPRCLAEFLKAKTYVAFRPSGLKKGESGCDREHFEMPEFIITPLPPLEAKEFKRIVERQDREQTVRNEED